MWIPFYLQTRTWGARKVGNKKFQRTITGSLSLWQLCHLTHHQPELHFVLNKCSGRGCSELKYSMDSLSAHGLKVKCSDDVNIVTWTSQRRLGSERPGKVVLRGCHPPGWLDRCGHYHHIHRITSSVRLPHTSPALVTDISWTRGCSSSFTTSCILTVNTGWGTPHPSLTISRLLLCQGSLPPSAWTIHLLGHVLDIAVIQTFGLWNIKLQNPTLRAKTPCRHRLCHMKGGYCSDSLRRHDLYPFLLNLWPVDCLVQKSVVEVMLCEF